MDYRKILQERLNQEIENLSISIETKNSLQNAIWGSLSFYTCLPIDILNSVPDSKKYLDQVIELSVSSSFYLVSLIMVDKLIDNQEKVNGADRQIRRGRSDRARPEGRPHLRGRRGGIHLSHG